MPVTTIRMAIITIPLAVTTSPLPIIPSPLAITAIPLAIIPSPLAITAIPLAITSSALAIITIRMGITSSGMGLTPSVMAVTAIRMATTSCRRAVMALRMPIASSWTFIRSLLDSVLEMGEPSPMKPLRVIQIFAVLLAIAPAVRAHELGKIQVYATFLEDGTYRVDVPIDPQHLTPGDAGLVGETRYGAVAGLTRESERPFGTFVRSFVDGATISFDGRPVEPKLEIAPPDPEAPPGRITLRLHGPIPGGARAFSWSNSMALGSYPLVLQNEGDESAVWQWLEGGDVSPPFSLAAAVVPPTRAEVMRLYLKLGFTHILPAGPDHILFVLGIFLLSRRLRPILQQVTAFTVAHTLTLGLSIYGVVSLPASIVEPLIALSIVFVAVENVLTPELRPSRIALVFCFGLLHGLGFAGVLSQLGLPRSEFLTALLSFNLGVEGGQLAVIGLAFLLVGLPFRSQGWYRQRVIVPASCLIAAVGVYWSIQRVFF
jgi:HupE / UreJ protein